MRPQGFVLNQMVALLATAGVLSASLYAGYTQMTRAGAIGNQKELTRQRLQQAGYVLITESLDGDADGIKEPAAFTAGARIPVFGGNLPAGSASPKSDGWSNLIGYCPWDNGTTNSSANRINGDSPGTTASTAFAMISAGPNGIFNTTCTQAKINNPQSDDLVVVYTQGQMLAGTSGLKGFGDPVANDADLSLIAPPSIDQVRLVTATGALKRWDGATWQDVGGGASSPPDPAYKDPVAYVGNLPLTGNTDKDVRVVIAENTVYMWSDARGAWRLVSPNRGLLGFLASWGYNGYGQLGLGDISDRSSPVQVGSLATWKSVSGGEFHALAVKTDGTLWALGRNGYGQLGLGDVTNRSSPVQVGSLGAWKSVSGGGFHTLAVKTDGTLWAWGYNGSGQLGLGDVSNRSSPVQVGSLSNWKNVAAGGNQAFAVKTDGTLWAWGWNGNGQLGLGDVSSRSSPVQVGSLADWKLVAAGSNHTLAVKIDSTLWAWGWNGNGQLGMGDVSDRSSPVQVAPVRWKSVSGGGAYTVAIRAE